MINNLVAKRGKNLPGVSEKRELNTQQENEEVVGLLSNQRNANHPF